MLSKVIKRVSSLPLVTLLMSQMSLWICRLGAMNTVILLSMEPMEALPVVSDGMGLF